MLSIDSKRFNVYFKYYKEDKHDKIIFGSKFWSVGPKTVRNSAVNDSFCRRVLDLKFITKTVFGENLDPMHHVVSLIS